VFADLSEGARRNPQLQQLIASTAFGTRQGAAMIPVMVKGRAELKARYATFEHTYGKITPEIVKRSHEAEEAWGRLKLATQGLKWELGSALSPALEAVEIGLTNVIEKSRDWIETDLPGYLKTSTSDVDGFGASLDSLVDSMGDLWDATEPLRDAMGDLLDTVGNAVANDIFDALGMQIDDLPPAIKQAMPAFVDLKKTLGGDFGATLRNITRAMNDLAAAIRSVGVMTAWAGSLLKIFKGKDIDLSPPGLHALAGAWSGTPPKGKNAAKKASDDVNVWDWSRWLDFSNKPQSTDSKPPGAAAGAWDLSPWFNFGGAGKSKSSSLGVRLNNPGNLRSWGDMPIVQTGSGAFAKFPTAQAGMSAAEGNLLAYRRHGWTNIADIIAHWAPSSENDTQAYIADIVKRTGFGAGQQLNVTDSAVAQKLLSAIVRHEQGSDAYSQSEVAAGISARLVSSKTAPRGQFIVGQWPKYWHTGGTAPDEVPQLTPEQVAANMRDATALKLPRSWRPPKLAAWELPYSADALEMSGQQNDRPLLRLLGRAGDAGSGELLSRSLLQSASVAYQPERSAAPKNGKVDIDVELKNLPPGTKTKVTASGDNIGHLDVGRRFSYM